ncbi:MAG TPA: DUF3307 domain-containing protein [Pricia sp.]|nr:DUF3307 domain-containing protein [Pricia sp.]
MDVYQLLVLQTLAHILTDFTFQTDKRAKDKNRKGFKSRYLKWHVLIMFLTSWALSLHLFFVFGALVIALTHWVIDGFKPHINKSKRLGRYAFFIDQGLHLSVLAAVVFFYNRWVTFEPMFDVPHIEYLLIFLAYLFCGKPANVVIKETFIASKIEFEGVKKDDLPNAGRLIGVVERWLVLTFILIGEFSAVGFLIAAKSILRYRDGEKIFSKTEYVLIGTLLSFGLAVGTGILIDIAT